jgi:hypothetical protein
MDHRGKLTQHLFYEEQEEHGIPSREKHRNRWRLFAMVPGSLKHDLARWATPQEECRILVSLNLDVVLLQREEGYFHWHEVERGPVGAFAKGS